jgi:hypothetical protein
MRLPTPLAVRLVALLSAGLVGCGAAPHPASTLAPGSSPTAERLVFWRDLRARDDVPPPDVDVAVLAHELVGYLAAPDPAVRDGLATDVLDRWIRRDSRLSSDAVRALIPELYSHLHAGTGARDDDSVFGRSFAALVLSMIAARDMAAPFLADAELGTMVTTAAWYAAHENDLRGYVEGRGWAHAAAHTADWLKWIARHPQLGSARAQAVLDAVASLTVRRHGQILHYGEDGRLAQPVLELLEQGHIDGKVFAAWLTVIAAPQFEQPAAGTTFDPVLFAAQRNSRNLIFTLFVALSMETAPNAGQSAALESLRQTIAG